MCIEYNDLIYNNILPLSIYYFSEIQFLVVKTLRRNSWDSNGSSMEKEKNQSCMAYSILLERDNKRAAVLY